MEAISTLVLVGFTIVFLAEVVRYRGGINTNYALSMFYCAYFLGIVSWSVALVLLLRRI